MESGKKRVDSILQQKFNNAPLLFQQYRKKNTGKRNHQLSVWTYSLTISLIHPHLFLA